MNEPNTKNNTVINNSLSNLFFKKTLSPSTIYGNEFGVKNFKLITNPKNIKNPFPEDKIVLQIYYEIKKNNYNELMEILRRLPNSKDITELLFKFIEELQKHNYTNSQLMAISTLLYRLSNIRFVSVESPKPFPPHSIPSIANIARNKELKNAKKIDSKIQEIVKNMITYYKLEIKNNKNYNSSNPGRLALKLRDILLSFIIEYTRPESNKTLEDESVFPPDATTENRWSKRVRELYGEKMNNYPPLLLSRKHAVLPWQEIRR